MSLSLSRSIKKREREVFAMHDWRMVYYQEEAKFLQVLTTDT